ncbi:MAG TPA: VOC family protein [Acidobacteriaceae bacterium]|jgi:PhnB protein|nr:VOC family protein [Acidobacteriaceae bacterium]
MATPAVGTAIVPWISVKKGRGVEAVEFYKRAFGAENLLLLDNEGGVVARMRVEGAEFWLADEAPGNGNFSPERVGGVTTRLILVVEDPDALWERAVAAGAKALCVMTDDHGWRVGGVLDPFGHHWEMAREEETK